MRILSLSCYFDEVTLICNDDYDYDDDDCDNCAPQQLIWYARTQQSFCAKSNINQTIICLKFRWGSTCQENFNMPTHILFLLIQSLHKIRTTQQINTNTSKRMLLCTCANIKWVVKKFFISDFVLNFLFYNRWGKILRVAFFYDGINKITHDWGKINRHRKGG